MFAAEIRRNRVDRLRAWQQWQWHLDEMFVNINAEIHYLWLAEEGEGEVIEAFVTKRRDRQAALKFLRKALKRFGQPKTIVTDRLRSYRSALKTIGNEGDQEVGRWLNNRAENSYLPLRRRERAMLRFGECEVSRNSPPSILPSTSISISNAISTTASGSRRTGRPRWKSSGIWPPRIRLCYKPETISHSSDSTAMYSRLDLAFAN